MNIAFDYIPGTGSREWILFIHGLGASRKSFDSAIKTGRFKEYGILNVDLIGFGESEKPPDFDYKMESQAGIIAGFLGEIDGIDRLHIAAHSLGGAVGLLLGDNILSRVSSFANLEGNLIAEDCNMFSRRVIKFSPEKYSSLLFPKQRKAFADHPLFDFENTAPAAVYRSSESLVKWSDSGELLRRFKALKCRKAYFYGEENRAIPVLERLKDIPLVEIRSSGHCMMTDNPEGFSRQMSIFIKG